MNAILVPLLIGFSVLSNVVLASTTQGCNKIGETEWQWYYSCENGFMYGISPGAYNQLRDPVFTLENSNELPKSVSLDNPFVWAYTVINQKTYAFHPVGSNSNIVQLPYRRPSSSYCFISEKDSSYYASCDTGVNLKLDLKLKKTELVNYAPKPSTLPDSKVTNNKMLEGWSRCLTDSKFYFEFGSCLTMDLQNIMFGGKQ